MMSVLAISTTVLKMTMFRKYFGEAIGGVSMMI